MSEVKSESEPSLSDLAMFGVAEINGQWRPILQRQATGEAACSRCSGFGTYGNPLCGVCITCENCRGSGLRSVAEDAISKPSTKSWWRRLLGLKEKA